MCRKYLENETEKRDFFTAAPNYCHPTIKERREERTSRRNLRIESIQISTSTA